MSLKDVASESRKKGILVVDDDEGMRGMLFLLLSRLGYRVAVAENGREALELFSKDRISLVLTDMCMPEMDGLTLAAKVKDASPNTPVIMITGSRIQEGAERGCVDHIIFKPFQLDDIHQAVEMALRGAFVPARTEQVNEIHLQG